MSLHVQKTGEGNPLCLLHGWALNGRVWDPIVSDLQQDYQILNIDLPGHGKSHPPDTGEYSLDKLAELISKHLPPDSILAGWSLGGLVAIKIACQFPQLVKKLILIASSPQFANSDTWKHGVKASIIDGFANDLTQNYRETILRFLAIQTLGSDEAKAVIRELREKVFANGEPHISSLSDGLRILQSSSLWEEASQIKCPTLVILGEKDSLIPKQSAEATQAAFQHCQLNIINGAGHAPFISHKDDFLKTIRDFM